MVLLIPWDARAGRALGRLCLPSLPFPSSKAPLSLQLLLLPRSPHSCNRVVSRALEFTGTIPFPASTSHSSPPSSLAQGKAAAEGVSTWGVGSTDVCRTAGCEWPEGCVAGVVRTFVCVQTTSTKGEPLHVAAFSERQPLPHQRATRELVLYKLACSVTH